MNWEKGSKRLVWVLSIVIGFASVLYFFNYWGSPEDAPTGLARLFLICLCGFGGPWLVYFIIRWIIKGFKADVPDRKDEPESKE